VTTKKNAFAGWILIVKEKPSEYEKSVAGYTRTSRDVHELLRERALSEGVERMYIVCLNGRNQATYCHEVSRGGLHGCAVSAGDILRVVLMAHASAFVLVHNHPSGDPSPSVEDVRMTKTVVKAAEAVGVPLVDHVIIAGWEKYASMMDLGMMED
jgi:DNA repair protein RadC